MINIPKNFELAGRKWTTHFMPSDDAIKHYTNRGGNIDMLAGDLEPGSGLCSPRFASIYIVKESGISAEYYYLIFRHEYNHAVMETLGIEEHDHVLVDAMAQLELQFIKTRRGSIELD